MFSKRQKPSPQKGESPIAAKLREIAEKEAKTRAEIEQCNKVIKEAPLRAEKIAQARREESKARAAHTETRRGNPAALHDRWRITMEANVAGPAQHKRLRSERRQGRLLFFVLLVTALGLGYYLYYTFAQA